MKNNNLPFLVRIIWEKLDPTINCPSEKIRIISDFRRMIGNALFGVHIPHDVIVVKGGGIGRLIQECLVSIGQSKVMVAHENILRDADTFHHVCIDDEVPTVLVIQPDQNLSNSAWDTLVSSVYGADTYLADDLGDVGVQVHPVVCLFTHKANNWVTPIDHMKHLLELNLEPSPNDEFDYELARKIVLSADEISLLSEWFSDSAINLPLPSPIQMAHEINQ